MLHLDKMEIETNRLTKKELTTMKMNPFITIVATAYLASV